VKHDLLYDEENESNISNSKLYYLSQLETLLNNASTSISLTWGWPPGPHWAIILRPADYHYWERWFTDFRSFWKLLSHQRCAWV